MPGNLERDFAERVAQMCATSMPPPDSGGSMHLTRLLILDGVVAALRVYGDGALAKAPVQDHDGVVISRELIR